MPYDVESDCSACGTGDKFTIGMWPENLGVFACNRCKAITNVPRVTGLCKCGHQPHTAEFYDYAYAIPYFGGQSLGDLEPGPDCPKCGLAKLTFKTTSHFNVGRLGATADGSRPWAGQDYLEKAIFFYAMIPICSEFDLNVEELLAYYNLDVPRSLLSGRRISFPIMLDIRSHLLAVAMAGEATFTVTPAMKSAIDERFGDLFKAVQPAKKHWWQFWK